MDNISTIKKVPLPSTVEDMLNRKTMALQNLNDHVDALHVRLFASSAPYVAYLDAVGDDEAQEGSLAADNIMAAQALRVFARNEGKDSYVGGKKLTSIARALNVVLKRYHISRKERAVSIGGEPMPNGE